MSVTTGPATTAVLPGFVRRNRVALALGLGVFVVLLLVTWVGRGSGSRGSDLDPQNTSPFGARALAQVLGEHGVPVEVVRGRGSFRDARVDARTTVVVSNPEALGRGTFAELDDRVRGTAGSVLVVAGISPVVADALHLTEKDLSTAPADDRTPADCSPAQPLLDGLTLSTPGSGIGVPGDGCFGSQAGRLLLVDRDAHRWVLLDGSPMSNEHVDEGENAAIALRLLGQRDRVLWYVADPDDVLAGEATGVSRFLPQWLVPAIWLVAIAALALLLQRGRRLGPLVTEPMPVTIRALETTTSLGRLYEKARDRGHAATLLVEGARRRLRQVLGAAPTTPVEDLVRSVAMRSGRPVREVADLLGEHAPQNVRSDADLVALAQELTQLEEEVRTV